ncbi:MAG TPA: FecR domain-containing protein [Planctomycetota bacterium]
MNERFEDQAAAYLDGTLEDVEDFLRELRENPEARRYLLLAAHVDVALYDLGAAPARSRRPLWIAAAAALLIAASLFWLARPAALIQGEVTFADGTKVLTWGDTILRRGDPFVLERGSFRAEVKPRERPFVVRTADAEIRVLGTLLILSTGPTRLDVAEGKVALTRLADGKSVIVEAGQFALARDLVPRPRGQVASPDAAPFGDGSFERPLPLARALAQPLAPGETLWLRGGTYKGVFRSALKGREGAPVVVRGYPGERATIDGGIVALGEWTVFRDFEIANSDPDRRPGRPEGLSLLGRGHKAVNLVIHDTGGAGIGFREAVGDGGEVYGCLLWGNGVYDAGTPYGSGISAQNADGRRFIRDSIVFRNFQSGLFVFAEKGHARGFQLEGNVAFDHPDWSVVATGGEHPLADFRMAGNVVYGRGVTSAVRVGLVPGGRTEDVALLDNTFVLGVGDEAFHVYQGENVTVTGNTIVGRDVLGRWTPAASGVRDWNRNAYFATVGPGRFLLPGGRFAWPAWKAATGFDADSALQPAPPETSMVVVRPNRYEEGRAHVTVLNWGRRASVEADLSGALRPGQAYVARDAQNYFGPPVARGVYDGRPVPLPMGPAEIARPVGDCPHLEVLLRPTSPEFAVFVISRE